MDKTRSVFSLILTILSRLLGATFAIVAISLTRDGDVDAAMLAVVLGAVFMFLPDLIKKRLESKDQ
ncbi:MAG: hypothetical protein IKX97_00910 [Erysipelotrichaceae bacterium]|nr:hypothetical protein [Erysipelotrichaceae bacterium]